MGERVFLCSVKDCGAFDSFVIATSASKARWAMVRAAWDANWNYTFADITVRRSPDHDWMVKPLPCSRSLPRGVPFDAHMERLCWCSVCTSDNRQYVTRKRAMR